MTTSRPLTRSFVLVSLAVIALLLLSLDSARAQTPCDSGYVDTYHAPQCDASGRLVPWFIDASGPFDHIMDIEAQWWLNAPNVNGWPTYITTAKLYRNYSAIPFAGAVQ